MKWLVLILMSFLLCTTGCESRKKQEEFRKREAALNEKEQELLLKEKTLELKEQELAQRQQKMDSTLTDTVNQYNPALVGVWNVSMTCTETSCAGYAVGDTRTDQWNISYEGNSIIARVITEGKLVRTYTGFYTGNTVELVENRPNTDAQQETKMVVRLRIIDNFSMEGEREIIRDNCKVLYSMKLDKQK